MAKPSSPLTNFSRLGFSSCAHWHAALQFFAISSTLLLRHEARLLFCQFRLPQLLAHTPRSGQRSAFIVQPVAFTYCGQNMANVQQDRGSPSLAAVAVASAIISGLAGYFLGQARSIGVFGRHTGARATVVAGDKANGGDFDTSDANSESTDEDVQDLGELKTFPDSTEECKLVLVVRSDLGMGKGMPLFVSTSYPHRYCGSIWFSSSTATIPTASCCNLQAVALHFRCDSQHSMT